MDAACPVSVSVSVASVTSPEYGRTGYTKSISIPMTARNRELMGDCEQLMARDRFNASLHTARLEQEGCVIMEGHVMLTACEREEEGGRYRFNIIGAGKRWAVHAMQHTFSSLFPDYAFKLDGESIAGQAYDDAVARLLGEERPLRFTTVEKKGFFSKLFGG